ncbi:hypothetical protein [Novosphingobium sp. 9]|uniref:hypothetical protein n=1 Tax=Novosphingobium sp. 9 TaxID=2025349 RepID=UPI0021B5D00E|nr:hypothetical protein [Novosphingobium sp. 9]
MTNPGAATTASALTLTFEEAEAVAADLARVWPGMTGIAAVPKVEMLADLVQRTNRKSREIIVARETSSVV